MGEQLKRFWNRGPRIRYTLGEILLLIVGLWLLGAICGIGLALWLGWNPYGVQFVVMGLGFQVWLVRKMKVAGRLR